MRFSCFSPAPVCKRRSLVSFAALVAAGTFAFPATPATPAHAATQAQTHEELRRLEKEKDGVAAPAEVLSVPKADGDAATQNGGNFQPPNADTSGTTHEGAGSSPHAAAGQGAAPAPHAAPASRALPAATLPTGVTVTLREIKFTPSAAPASTIFSDAELAAFAAPYVNTPLRIADLHKLTATLNAEYAKRGYPVNIANIPPQKIKDGLVHIALIEAHLGDIRVEGNRRLSAEYITERLGLAPQTPVHVGSLEDHFVYFNRTDRAALVAELKPGRQVGTTDIVARVQEPPTVEFLAFADNAGRSTTGLYRGTAMVRGYSWLASGDSASLAAVYSEGTRTAFGAYEIPIGSLGDAIGGSYAYGETKVISGPFEPLNVTGVSHSADFYFSMPIYASGAFSLKGLLHGTYYNSTTDFVEVLTDREETYGGTLGLEGDWNDASGRWAFTGELRGGRANIGDSSAVTDPRAGGFWKLTGQISRTQRLNDVFTAFFAAGGQFAPTNRLASSEQIQVGGVGTVRGYPEGSLLADHGYFARAELWLKPLWITKDSGTVESFIARTFSFFVFVDHAGGFPYKGHGATVGEADFLTSWGAGVAFNYNDIFTAQVTGAEPLNGIPSGKKAQNVLFRVGCHFSW